MQKMNQFKKYIPIQKIDDEERMVYGFASTPDLDSDGEVIELSAMEKALPEYMKFPTIREMHQPKAAGTTVYTEIRDNKKEKGLYIGAKIVADDAWKMVKEGVYKGFSIGGHVLSRFGNIIKAIDLVEISLVDVPANKQARIELWKRQKMTKSAETVMMLTSLLGYTMQIASEYEYMGKKPTKLMRMIEVLKTMIASEANEAEADKFVSELTLFKFDNPIGEKLRRGVIKLMSKKTEDLTKNEQVVEETTEEVVETETPTEEVVEEVEATEGEDHAEEEEEVVTEEETTEEVVETEEVTEEETKESAATTTLTKIEDVSKKLDAMSKTEKVEEKGDLAKAVSLVSDQLSKVTSILEDLSARLEKVESTPAAVKAKAGFVFKSEAEEPKAEASTATSELETKKARLAEIMKTYDQLGKAAFAKIPGLSQEAMRLQEEIRVLEPR